MEYIATDEARQKIPWVRMTDAQGVVTVFKTKNFTNDIANMEIRTMDCMDCHNRPSHRYLSPEKAVNQAMALRQIDPTMPWIKTNAVYVLTRKYNTDDRGARRHRHRAGRDVIPTIRASAPPSRSCRRFTRTISFPEMKANWSVYPDNVGHMIWPGCFRCHDGKHKTEDGKRTIKANDCNACHTILAQGAGDELQQLTPGGQKFKHPGGDYDLSCTDCHTGGP